jgi:hypothetical protein
MKKIIFLTAIALFLSATPMLAQSAGSDFCTSINAIIASFKKDFLVSAKGTLIGTNNEQHFSNYQSKFTISDAKKNEITLYTQSPNLNECNITFLDQPEMDAAMSAKFAAVLKELQKCMKDWKMEQLSGKATGELDQDGDFPDVVLSKKGFPSVELSIDNERRTGTVVLTINIAEAEDED